MRWSRLIVAILISLLVLTSCKEQAPEINVTDGILADEDIFISASWDSKIPCDERSEEQVYADIRVSRRLGYTRVCTYKFDGNIFGNGTFEKGISENIYIGRGNIFQNHSIEICCDGVCVESRLNNLCEEEPKLIERDVLEENFTTSETEYFYFTAKELGRYQVYVNTQCSFCNDKLFSLEIMTLAECDKKKNEEEYEVIFEIKNKRTLFTQLSLPHDTELCLAFIPDDVNVSKHILVKGSWIG